MQSQTRNLMLGAALAGVFALAGCGGANGPSEAQMSTAIQKSAESLGGHINDPELQKAITECKAGAPQISDGSGQTMVCADLCGTTPGKCDLTVKVSALKKDKCTAVKEKPGVFDCTFTMTIASPSKWLNTMLHQADAGATDESKIPRTTQFKQVSGTWVVADM